MAASSYILYLIQQQQHGQHDKVDDWGGLGDPNSPRRIGRKHTEAKHATSKETIMAVGSEILVGTWIVYRGLNTLNRVWGVYDAMAMIIARRPKENCC